MRDVVSESETESSSVSWSPFDAWKSTIHDVHAAQSRRSGQSWADYMDELEEHLLLQRRRVRQRVAKWLLALAFAIALYAML